VNTGPGAAKKDQRPQLVNQIVSTFDSGSKDNFFLAWNKLVPRELRDKDFKTKRLEFYLRIYFVIFTFHPQSQKAGTKQKSELVKEKELKKAQADFKTYLDTAGSDLSKTSEFLAFYALPYIPDPT
jgi:hypothetical protein